MTGGYFDQVDHRRLLAEYPVGPAFLDGPARLSGDELHALRQRRFLELVARGWQVPFYRRHWGAQGIEPGDIRSLDDIVKLPPFSKSDLMASVAEHPPFGDYHGVDLAAADRPNVVLHTTSGTTGTPQPLFFGAWDREVQNALLARAYLLQGLSAADVVHSVYGFGMVNGGHYVREAILHFTPALLLPAGTGLETRSEQQVRLMRDFGATVAVGFVDFIKRLAEVAREQGIEPGRDIPLRMISGHIGQEDSAAISALWGGAAIYDWYGVGDTGIIAAEGSGRDGLHVWEDAHILEILDPETGAPQPDGEPGNMCVSVLFKTTVYPVIRFNTNDVSRLLPPDPASGINFRRIPGFLGRSDNMVKLRGVNVYPTAIGALLDELEGLTGEYVCRVTSEGSREVMTVLVEAAQPDDAALAQSVAAHLRRRLGVEVGIELVGPGKTAPLTEIERRQKPIRLIDERNGLSDPTTLDIAEASAGLRAGTITAEALLDAYLARIERYDGRINAYITVLAVTAREQAKASDRRLAARKLLSPLDGIPIALKDNIDVAGVVTSNGMRRDVVADTDAMVVERLEAAGAVIIGKLNMHEGALGGTTNNAHHGATHNPWRFGHTPGGSSGGSGAAVAARLCAGALGTDTMGSVRLPAAYCGVAGLKATTGLISTRGVMPLSYGLDHVGPLCRSVRDLGLLTAVLAGSDPQSPESCAAPADWQAWRGPVKSLAGCTVGVVGNFAAEAMEPAVADGFAQSLDVLRALGAEVREVTIADYDATRARLAGFLISEAEGAYALNAEMAATPAAFSEDFRRMLLYGRDTPAAKLVQAQRLTAEAGLAIRRLFDNVDLLATPTAPQLPFAFTASPPSNQADFTAIGNFGRCPAVSVPCGLSPDDLPVALQLLAPPFAEVELLAAAAAFEAAVGSMPTPPGYP